MFGYITINKSELKIREYNRYRAFYCGLCRTLKQRSGRFGELTLTYDMTFLIMLLGALYEPEEKLRYRRCELHPVQKHAEITTRYSEYGADMNVILAYYKQLDDWQDEKKLSCLSYAFLLKRRVKKLEKAYPKQVEAIKRELSFLRTLEKNRVYDPEKAARSFGRLLGAIFCAEEDLWQTLLYRTGYYLGMYIYLADAYDDLEKDREKGAYNPFLEKLYTKERIHHLLMEIMAQAAAAFERLPLTGDTEILRNIIYSGVWMTSNRKKKQEKVYVDERSL